MDVKQHILTNSIQEQYKYREFRDVKVLQRLKDGFVNLNEMVKFVNDKYKFSFKLSTYLKSKDFYVRLLDVDTTIQSKSFVYLLDFPDEGYFKIGRTFDILQRYPKNIIEKNLIELVPVTDDKKAERALLDFMETKYTKVEGTNESFYYKSIQYVLRYFRSVIKQNNFEVDLPSLKSKLINLGISGEKDTYGHIEIARIIINHLLKASDRKNWDLMFIKLIHEIPNTTLDFIYNKEEKAECLYWYMDGYIYIKNLKTNYYNISRLVNSVSRTDKTDKKLNMYMARSKRFNDMIESYKAYSGNPDNTGIYKYQNKSQPLLSGYWMDEIYLLTILRWLNPSLEFEHNYFILNTLKILSNPDLSPEEKIKKIQDVMTSTLITNKVFTTSLINKDEFDANLLFNDKKNLESLTIRPTFERMKYKFD